MAVNLFATRKGPTSGYTGPESRKSGRASEIWEISASSNASADDTSPAAGTAGALTTAMSRPQQVIGPYKYSISGRTVTLTAIVAQTTAQVMAVEVIGLP